MKSIKELEDAVRVEEEAVERAFQAANPTAIALFRVTLRRAHEELNKARIQQGEM